MSEIKTKQELIERLKTSRVALEMVIAKVPAERMIELGVVEGWSVKDMLAHITVWLSRTITVMFQAERGQRPSLGIVNSGDHGGAGVACRGHRWLASIRGGSSRIAHDVYSLTSLIWRPVISEMTSSREVSLMVRTPCTAPRRMTWT